MTNELAMMNVKITVWPIDAPSFSIDWAMPVDSLDDRGMRALLASYLRQRGMQLCECVAELTVDGRVIVSISQQVKMVRRIKMYPA